MSGVKLPRAADGLACHASCIRTWRARLAPAADTRVVRCIEVFVLVNM